MISRLQEILIMNGTFLQSERFILFHIVSFHIGNSVVTACD